MARIYIPPSTIETGLNGETMELDFETSKKLTRVLRLTPGEVFVAFDGFGGEWDCALAEAGDDDGFAEEGKRAKKNRNARAVILNEREAAVAGRLHISVAQAIPKGEKMEFVLQKGTELGVAEFWPFSGGRSVPVFDDDDRASARTERWRKVVQNAASQCGRADVPVVHAISEFATAVDYGTNNSRCFMLDETSSDEESLRATLQREPLQLDSDAPAKIMLLVGPEGGWTEREREWADRYGVERVSLGRLVLRTETAALAATSIFQWEAGELG